MIQRHYVRVAAAVLLAATAVNDAAASFTLNMRNGRFPTGVLTENANGNTPSTAGYKRGWTDKGWTVDQFGDKGYVALCPSYYKGEAETECESVLTMPEQMIEAGDIIRWTARAVYEPRPEKYRIEVMGANEDGWTVLGEFDAKAKWETHVLNIDRYAGAGATFRIVCTSVNGYMLAVSDFFIGTPDKTVLVAENTTGRFFSADAADRGTASVELSIFNAGKTIESGTLACLVELQDYSKVEITDPWQTGETRTFSLDAPAEMNKMTEYIVTFREQGAEDMDLVKSDFFTSHFERNLFVDKATGMWCTNCPAGVIAIENLAESYGRNFISVDTHIAGTSVDVLENPVYYSYIQNYGVPMLMLDRIRESRGDDAKNFNRYYDREVNFRIGITGITTVGNDALSVTTEVESAYDLDNSDGRYRIGYVLTADFHKEDNKTYFQVNGCNNAMYRQFYFLPSRIMSDLIWFHDVSLTSQDAFSGIEGSIPASLEKGKTYSFSWSIDRPELLEDILDGRVAVYVLDTQTGHIENAFAAHPGEVDAVGEIEDSAETVAHPGIYTLQGIRLDRSLDELPAGIYIVNGKKILK